MSRHHTFRFEDGDFALWAAQRPDSTSIFRVRSDRDPLERQREKGIIGRLRPATAGEAAQWMALKDFWPRDVVDAGPSADLAHIHASHTASFPSAAQASPPSGDYHRPRSSIVTAAARSAHER